ncbi:MAG: hypothetical protein GY779_03340 [Gammaproteobacteria bacterium]|nr:hypothetical protein [Gammaproteobacteria bacterium]
MKSIYDGSTCVSLGVITGRSPPLALSASIERIGAMNSAYNKVADLGGNAIVILSAERLNNGGGVVQGEAFDCEVVAKDMLKPHPTDW